jgi:hypothetical protein
LELSKGFFNNIDKTARKVYDVYGEDQALNASLISGGLGRGFCARGICKNFI